MTKDGKDALRWMLEVVMISLRDVPPDEQREALRKAELRIRREYGGDEVYIGRASRMLIAERDALIRAAIEAGEVPEVVAKQHQISPRQLRRRVRGRNA